MAFDLATKRESAAVWGDSMSRQDVVDLHDALVVFRAELMRLKRQADDEPDEFGVAAEYVDALLEAFDKAVTLQPEAAGRPGHGE